MTDVIAEPCTGVKDGACAGECPAGCIYEASGCPTSAAASAPTVAPASRCARSWAQFTGENVRFFGQLRSPGGASRTGPLPDDTDHVASFVTSR